MRDIALTEEQHAALARRDVADPPDERHVEAGGTQALTRDAWLD